MSDHSPELTLDDLEKLYSQLLEANEKRIRVDRELDDLFFNEHKVEVVESPVFGVEPEVLRLGRVPASITMVKGLFDEYPTYSLLPLGTGIKALAQTERVERFLNAVPKQAERESREDTYGLTLEEVLRFGRSFEVVLRADAHSWPEYPQRGNYGPDSAYNKATEEYKRIQRLPISIRHIPIAPATDGISAFPLLAGGDLYKFVSVHKITVGEALQRFGKEGQGRKPEGLSSVMKALGEEENFKITSELKLLTYYDDERCVYAIMDGPFKAIVRQWEHKQEEQPVVLFEGLTTSDPSPERRWKAIYQDAREVIVHEDRLASRQATNVRINYYKSYVALADDNSPEGGPEHIEFKPSQITLLRGVKQFGPVQTDTASQEAQLLEGKLERMLERHLLPSVLMGAQGATDEPAWGTNLRIRQAENRFKEIGRHMASGRVIVAQNILRAVMAIGERVYAVDENDQEWSITPEEAKRYINRIRVKIEPKTLVDRNADVQAAQGLDGLKVPKRQIFEDVLGYEQPGELMIERVLEDMQFDPESPLYQDTVEWILRRADLIEEKENAATDDEVLNAVAGVGPGAAGALMETIGMGGGGEPALPVGAGFFPTEPAALAPATQIQMRSGRRQGRQPRAKRLPGPADRYKQNGS